MKKLLNLLLTITIFTTTIYAKNISQDWTVLHNGQGSIVEVYDNEKKAKVIEFFSHSNKDTYINGAKKGKRAWNNRKSKTLRWSFKYSQNYVAIVTLATIKGYRNIVYTANDKNFKSYIGLGSHTTQGEWVTVTRNLEEDLRQQDPTNKIIAVNGFVIRGDGRVADVHMLNVIKRSIVKSLYRTIQEALLYLRNKEYLRDSLASKEKEPKHRNSNAINRAVPTITLINGNKMYLNLGDKFVDPGVIAEDSNGDPLDVELIGDINESRVDVYPLHYLAIDKNGNATLVTREVTILSKDIKGLKKQKEESKKSEKKKTIKKDENIKADINSSKEVEPKDKSEEEDIEDVYKQELRELGQGEKSEEQEAIDDIFENAEGETYEERLQDIATKLETLMDGND